MRINSKKYGATSPDRPLEWEVASPSDNRMNYMTKLYKSHFIQFSIAITALMPLLILPKGKFRVYYFVLLYYKYKLFFVYYEKGL